MKEPQKVYNRGFWGGYYLGQKLGEWSKQYGSKASKTKVYLGKVLNYYGNHSVAELRIDTGEDLSLGEEVLFLGPTTGVVQQFVKELRKDLIPVEKVEQAQLFSMQTVSLVRRGDKMYKLVDTEELKKGIRESKS